MVCVLLGKRGVTSECVARVKSLIAKDPELGFQIDLQMKQAVNLAEEALKSSAEIGFSKRPNLFSSRTIVLKNGV